MKTEFATPKDLEKLRVEMVSKAGGKIDPTHPDMGPIMDSLIMTSKTTEHHIASQCSHWFYQMTGPT